ncbi:MAG: hypothetical protein ACOYNY_35135 [Caldilineaceae bacterium]
MDKTIFKELNSFVPNLAYDSTISISVAAHGGFHQWGTGTLLRIADSSFIVTAAHVVSQVYYNKLQLYTPRNGSFVHLYGDWAYLTDSDLFDVAILRLHPDIVSNLGTASYIGLYNISLNNELSKGIFCLCGYPARLSKPSTPTEPLMTTKPLQVMSYMYTGDTDNIANYNAKHHFLLSSKTGFLDIDGEPMKLIGKDEKFLNLPRDLGGISGCSIWQIGTSEIPLEQWNSKRAKIVGIQTSVFPENKVIKVTRWSAVASLLYEAYPDIHSAMSLWYSD